MIRARITDTKSGIEKIFLGLTEENLRLLKEDKPVLVTQDDELRLGADLIVFLGKDELDCIAKLEAEGVMPPGAVKDAEKVMDEGGGAVDVETPKP